MLQECLFTQLDTKLAKRNTNLQVNMYINCRKDISGRDRTDNSNRNNLLEQIHFLREEEVNKIL